MLYSFTLQTCTELIPVAECVVYELCEELPKLDVILVIEESLEPKTTCKICTIPV